MTKSKGYTGELARRLPSLIDAVEQAAGKEELDRLFDLDFDRKYRKMRLLLEHYGLSFGKSDRESVQAFYMLALRLAENHVPGFKEAKPPGRPQVWNARLRVQAAVALGRLSAEYPKENQSKLAARLLQQPRWAGRSRTPGALLRQIRMLNTDRRETLDEFAPRQTNRLMEILAGGRK